MSQESNVSLILLEDVTTKTKTNLNRRLIILCLITFVGTLISTFGFKHNLPAILGYLEAISSNYFIFNLILILLYILVSLPFLWGYTICILICSYIYSFIYGFLLTSFYSAIGMTISFYVCRYHISKCAYSTINSKYIHTLVHIIESQNGFKVIILSRLVPLPFGLANTLFALTNVGYLKYILSSCLGLIPSQLLTCYMGSTLKSLSDALLVDSKTAKTATIIFIGQFIFIFIFMFYLFKLARAEFEKQLNSINF
jgi:protein maelstrom